MEDFKIENFCEKHNKEFKIYYEYLNNPSYEKIILFFLKFIHHEKIKKKIFKMIPENHILILNKINKINIIISFYQKNNLINKSEIGKFFTYYQKCIKNKNINNHEDLYNLFYELISYDNCILLLKECFYIFSDYRACIYYMTPSINFYKTSKENISLVIMNFIDNINTLNQLISKIYLGEINPWGSVYYSSAFSMFETLYILNKYFKDPLKKLKIIFKVDEICKKELININLLEKYKNLKLNNNLIIHKINNVSDFIIKLKKLGFDLWFVIPFVFNTIYKKYNLNGFPESLVFGYEKIYYQKINNLIGIMCFILLNNDYISNINIFKNFND
jgi:hypothetical protein